VSDEAGGGGGFLPPQAPGGRPPPQFAPPGEAPDADHPAPATAPQPAPESTQEPTPPTFGGYAPPAGASPPSGATPPSAPRPVTGMPSDEGNGIGITAFSLGIAGFVMFVFSGFGLIFVLNLPFSIAAWILGPKGVRKVDEGKTAQHRGLAQAGKVMGIVGTILGVVAVALWALLIAFSDDVRDELDRIIDDATEDAKAPDNDSLDLNTIRVLRLLAPLLRMVTG